MRFDTAYFLFNPNLGGLFRGLFCGRVGGSWRVGECKITPCLKLVRIMLETWNLVPGRHWLCWCRYVFFAKNQHFLAKIVPKQEYRSCVGDFSFVFSFCKIKGWYWSKHCITNYASGILLPDCSKPTTNWKNYNDVKIYRHDVIVNFFWRCCVFLVKFTYWFKFQDQ